MVRPTSHFKVLGCVQRANYMAKLSFHFFATELAQGGLSIHPNSGSLGSIEPLYVPPPTCALIMFTWLIHARWLLVKLMRHCFSLSAGVRGRYFSTSHHPKEKPHMILSLEWVNFKKITFVLCLLGFCLFVLSWGNGFATSPFGCASSALAQTNKARKSQAQHDGHCKDDLQSGLTLRCGRW